MPWIPTGERSGLLTRIATMESVTLCTRMRADEKVTAFMELRSATRTARAKPAHPALDQPSSAAVQRIGFPPSLGESDTNQHTVEQLPRPQLPNQGACSR